MPRQDANLWRSITCGCVLWYRVDGQGNMVYLPFEGVRQVHEQRKLAGDLSANFRPTPEAVLCTEHAGLGKTLGQALIPTIQEEHRLRAKALQILQDGGKRLEECLWWFDSQRVLHVKAALSPDERVALNKALKSALGSGRVELD